MSRDSGAVAYSNADGTGEPILSLLDLGHQSIVK